MSDNSLKINAYCYFHKLLWLGWIIVKNPQLAPLYYDNTPTVTISNESELKYITLGFTRKGTLKRLKKYIERNLI